MEIGGRVQMLRGTCIMRALMFKSQSNICWCLLRKQAAFKNLCELIEQITDS